MCRCVWLCRARRAVAVGPPSPRLPLATLPRARASLPVPFRWPPTSSRPVCHGLPRRGRRSPTAAPRSVNRNGDLPHFPVPAPSPASRLLPRDCPSGSIGRTSRLVAGCPAGRRVTRSAQSLCSVWCGRLDKRGVRSAAIPPGGGRPWCWRARCPVGRGRRLCGLREEGACCGDGGCGRRARAAGTAVAGWVAGSLTWHALGFACLVAPRRWGESARPPTHARALRGSRARPARERRAVAAKTPREVGACSPDAQLLVKPRSSEARRAAVGQLSR